MKGIALTLAVVLGLISLLHLYWMVRGVGTGAGVPSTADGKPVIRPGRLASAAVAAALALAAMLVLGRSGLIETGLPLMLLTVGTWGVAATFAARTVGEFRYVGIFKRVRGTSFARMDDRLYTPLCALMAVAAGLVARS